MNEKQLEMMAGEHDLSAMDPEMAEEVAKEAVKLVQATAEGVTSGYKKVENALVGGYKKVENAFVGGYKKIEAGAVEGFGKVVDKCVEVLFAAEGESVEDAKKRLSGKVEK